MSVELILSHKQVVLDPYHHSTLNIKATFATLPTNLYALYKVSPGLGRSEPIPRIWSM